MRGKPGLLLLTTAPLLLVQPFHERDPMNPIKQRNGEAQRRRLATPPIPFDDGILTETEYDNRMMLATTAELSKLFFSPEFEEWQRKKRKGVENIPKPVTINKPRRMASIWLVSAISSIVVVSGLYSAYGKNSMGGQSLQTPLISLPLITSMASLVRSQQVEQPAVHEADFCTEGENCGVSPSESERECTDGVGFDGGCGGTSEGERIKQLEEELKHESAASEAWQCVVVMIMCTWAFKEFWSQVAEIIPLLVTRAMFKKKKK